uniref:Uncharacterized protein LOC116941002 n=1 Tax=Petromyzon marinus TaxID=7757 RepID=A0AAJ7SZG0_PETMA|nr:uncharacterized protein LOC116941002 [Petromyzon marinus]
MKRPSGILCVMLLMCDGIYGGIVLSHRGATSATFVEGLSPVRVFKGEVTVLDQRGTMAYIQASILNAVDGQAEVLSTGQDGGPGVPWVQSSDGTLTLLELNGAHAYQSALAALTYANLKHNPDPRPRHVHVIAVRTGGRVSAALNTTVLIRLTNRSPFFNHGPLHTLYTVENANKWSQVPHTVLGLFGSLINDTDTGDQLGIAIVGADNSHGQWEYLTWPGSWKAMSEGSSGPDRRLHRSSTLLRRSVALRATWGNFLRFLPAPHFNGNSTVSVVAWDSTGHTASVPDGGMVNATFVDDSCPFSREMLTITMVVLSVNDAPWVSPEPLWLSTVAEDSLAPPGDPITLLLDICRDPDVTDPAQALGVAVTDVENTNGQWEYSADGGGTWLALESSLALMDAMLLGEEWSNELYRLRFVPRLHYTGRASLRFKAWDFTDGRKAGTRGVNVKLYTPFGAYSQWEGTVLVQVTPVNHSPSLDTAALSLGHTEEGSTGGEGTRIRDSIWGHWSDPDPKDDRGVAVVSVDNSHGRWQFSCDAGDRDEPRRWTEIGGTSVENAVLLLVSCAVRFVPKPLFNTELDLSGDRRPHADRPSLGVLAWDNTGRSAGMSGQSGVNISYFNESNNTEFGKLVVSAYATVKSVNDRPVIKSSKTIKYINFYVAHGPSPVFFNDLLLYDLDSKYMMSVRAKVRYAPATSPAEWDCRSDDQHSHETLSVKKTIPPAFSVNVLSLCPYSIEIVVRVEANGRKASASEYTQMLTNLQYNNTSPRPSLAQRYISLQAWDGEDWSDTLEIGLQIKWLPTQMLLLNDLILNKKVSVMPVMNVTLLEGSEVSFAIVHELATQMPNLQPQHIQILPDGLNVTSVKYDIYSGIISIQGVSGQHGVEKMHYAVDRDGNGGYIYGLLVIIVLQVNHSPVCESATYEVLENSLQVIDMQKYFSDRDHAADELTFSLIISGGIVQQKNLTLPSGSHVSSNGGASLVFSPAKGYVGPELIQFMVCDPCADQALYIKSELPAPCEREANQVRVHRMSGLQASGTRPGCGMGTLTILVLNVNNPPVIRPLSAIVLTHQNITFQLFSWLFYNQSEGHLSTPGMVLYDPDDAQAQFLLGLGLNPSDYGLSSMTDLDVTSLMLTETPHLGVVKLEDEEERPLLKYTASAGSAGYDWFTFRVCDRTSAGKKRACTKGSVSIQVTNPGPSIVSFTAIPALTKSSENAALHSDSKISSGDMMVVEFDMETNLPPLQKIGKLVSKQDIDKMFNLSTCWNPALSDYVGTWLSPKQFVIVVLNVTVSEFNSNRIDQCLVTVRGDVGQCGGFVNDDPLPASGWSPYCLTTTSMSSAHTVSRSPPLQGSWGLTIPKVTGVIVQNDHVPLSLIVSGGRSYLGKFSMITIALQPPLSESQLLEFCSANLGDIVDKDAILQAGFVVRKLQCLNRHEDVTVGSSNIHMDSNSVLKSTKASGGLKAFKEISDYFENYQSNVTSMPVSTDLTLFIDSSNGYNVEYSQSYKLFKRIIRNDFLINLVSKDSSVRVTEFVKYNELHANNPLELYFAHFSDATPKVTKIDVNDAPIPVKDFFSRGDIITIEFDRDTDTPLVSTRKELDKVVNFSTVIGKDYIGQWLNKKVLQIKIKDSIDQPHGPVDVVMSFRRSAHSHLRDHPAVSKQLLNCVGVNVCGSHSGGSVGVCEARQLSCRAEGTFNIAQTAGAARVTSTHWWSYAVLTLVLGLLLNTLVVLWIFCCKRKSKKGPPRERANGERKATSVHRGTSPADRGTSPVQVQRARDSTRQQIGQLGSTSPESSRLLRECVFVDLSADDPANIHRTLLKPHTKMLLENDKL